MNQEFLKQLILDGFTGKNRAIHAYDRMIWMVRSGFLTLVFAAWGFLIKTALEQHIAITNTMGYIQLLAGFSLVLAYGGYIIDVNYVKRKFRVITTVNELRTIVIRPGMSDYLPEEVERLRELLKISGDSVSIDHRSPQFENERRVSRVIYGLPSLLIILLLLTTLK